MMCAGDTLISCGGKRGAAPSVWDRRRLVYPRAGGLFEYRGAAEGYESSAAFTRWRRGGGSTGTGKRSIRPSIHPGSWCPLAW